MWQDTEYTGHPDDDLARLYHREQEAGGQEVVVPSLSVDQD